MICVMDFYCDIILTLYSNYIEMDYLKSIRPSLFLVGCYLNMCSIIHWT